MDCGDVEYKVYERETIMKEETPENSKGCIKPKVLFFA